MSVIYTLRIERYLREEDPRREIWESWSGPIVGYIGKTDSIKRGDRMVDIAIRLRDEEPKAAFVIIGAGGLEQAARHRLREYPELANRVFLLGEQPDAASLARYFDVGVLCSDYEGLPNVLLEYMSLGVPCVSTDVGDVDFVLDSGHAGVVVAGDPVASTAEAVLELLRNPEQRCQLADRGKERLRSLFTLERAVHQFTCVYERLLESSSPHT